MTPTARPAAHGALLAALALAGCASVPRGQYGVDALEIEGAEQLSERAIERCLMTVEREHFELVLGLSSSKCGEPPFDHSARRLQLWRWPWTDWPGLNAAVMEVDRQRIERFYRARGFYDARVLSVRYTPPAAGDPTAPPDEAGCDPRHSECLARVEVVVEEGEPLRIGEVRVKGLEPLSAPLRARIEDQELLEPGARFDELDYDRGKERLVELLAEGSHATAEVDGEVRLDHARKLANVTYALRPGPSFEFGRVRVTGHEELGLPGAPIVTAAGIRQGEPYRQSALREVQQEVYALGAFSSVEVEREVDAQARRVDLVVKVDPLPRDAFRLGIGITSGTLQRTESGTLESVPQWDMHLLARYERRHVFGTLGKLRIEERPRLIYQLPFPEVEQPQPGNTLRVRLSEPGLIEARTELVLQGLWDYGPDPFLAFLRSDVALRLGAERAFFRRDLHVELAVQHDRFLVANDTRTSDGSEVPDSYVYSFLAQELRLDLRDDEVQPRAGVLLLLSTAQSVRMPLSDWTALRVAPDARAFVPLPLGMVLAGRFALGAIFILDARSSLDAASAQLGPANYRLRGGGAQSNRGFVAGQLGVGPSGGIRRWESSVELRVRLGSSFSFVVFEDMGDVNDGESFRWGELNPSVGFGIRYLTLIGAIRADLGFRVGEVEPDASRQFLIGQPGALHFTLGEAF